LNYLLGSILKCEWNSEFFKIVGNVVVGLYLTTDVVHHWYNVTSPKYNVGKATRLSLFFILFIKILKPTIIFIIIFPVVFLCKYDLEPYFQRLLFYYFEDKYKFINSITSCCKFIHNLILIFYIVLKKIIILWVVHFICIVQ
jgi:hypothetical protein